MEELSNQLYIEQPKEILYHYTSLNGLMKIVESQALYATDIQYFNDAAEMRHTQSLLNIEIDQRIEFKNNSNKHLLVQLKKWLADRLTNGHTLFVSSFTTNGNLLSQWRGYCPKGKGISVGFHPQHICSRAIQQSFQIGRCIYDSNEQKELAVEIIDVIEILAEKYGENTDYSKRHPSESFYDIFENIEANLLRIAALLKNPFFKEENEWRIVSPIITNYVEAPILYREGLSTLVPYIKFSLPSTQPRLVEIEHVFLGPTPNINISMKSLSQYLSKYGASPRQGISYCQIPYRDW